MNLSSRLYYRQPAREWTEALPLGNGRLGAMAYFGVPREVLKLNEDTLWSGCPVKKRAAKDPVGALARAREALNDGDYTRAQKGMELEFTSNFSQAYMPLGDLTLEFAGQDDWADYSRSLDLNMAVARCEYSSGGARYTRETFISAPDQALVYRVRASEHGKISAKIVFSTCLRASLSGEAEFLIMDGECPWRARPGYVNDPHAIQYDDEPEKRGVCFRAMVMILPRGGKSEYHADGTCDVRNADELEIRLFARSSFRGPFRHPFLDGRDYPDVCREDVRKARALSFDEMKRRHTGDYSQYYDRVRLSLCGDAADDIPTDERLVRFQAQKRDPILYELIFNFGRYLMISASRPDTTAMNLQGIWNDSMLPPWSSNYTININTEMNYWPAEICALGEMAQPLFRLVEALRVTGADTAKTFYGARGAVSHHNTDVWAMSNPVGEGREGCGAWATWQMSFGWLSRHLYDHYLFTLDKEFLKTSALPALLDAARFYLDVLCPVDGRLAVSPTSSPENTFTVNGERHNIARAAAMSDAIVREVFENARDACGALGEHPPILDEILAALPNLRPLAVGSQGQILEWDREYGEAEPHHRHTSHLYALHPAHQITPEGTPALADACKRTLELRGDDGTGWSLGWKINFWARLNDGDHALRLLKNQLRFVPSGNGKTEYTHGGGTYANMFDAHPPFQIDGNFGASAGIAEMLMRSEPEALYFLPALPGEWPDGEIRGLCAMNDMRVDIAFSGGKLSRAKIVARQTPPAPVRVLYGGETALVVDRAGVYDIAR